MVAHAHAATGPQPFCQHHDYCHHQTFLLICEAGLEQHLVNKAGEDAVRLLYEECELREGAMPGQHWAPARPGACPAANEDFCAPCTRSI